MLRESIELLGQAKAVLCESQSGDVNDRLQVIVDDIGAIESNLSYIKKKMEQIPKMSEGKQSRILRWLRLFSLSLLKKTDDARRIF